MIYQISEISAPWASNFTMDDLNGVDRYKNSSEVPRGAELEPYLTTILGRCYGRGNFKGLFLQNMGDASESYERFKHLLFL
jgi:hypothetical protein